MKLKKETNISTKTVAYAGAKIAIAAVFSYSLLALLYTIIRSSLTIYNIMPSGERSDILLLNGFSIAYSVAIFSILMGLFSSLVGAVAAVVLKKSLVYFNPQFNYIKTLIVSAMVAFATLIFIYALLYALLKEWMTFNYIETFSFWFLLPAIIFFITVIVCGIEMNKAIRRKI